MLSNKPIGLPEEVWWKQLCKQSNTKQKNLEVFLRKCGIANPYDSLWVRPAQTIFGKATTDEITDAILMLNCCSIATWLFYMRSFAKLFNPKLGTLHNAVNAAIQDFKKKVSVRMGFIDVNSNDIKVYINSGVASPLDTAQLYPIDSVGNSFNGQSYINHLMNLKPTCVQNVDVTFLRNLVKHKVIQEKMLCVSDVVYLSDGVVCTDKMNVLDNRLPPYEVSSAIKELPKASIAEHNGDMFATLLDIYEANPDNYSSVVYQYLLNNLLTYQETDSDVPAFQSFEVPDNIETMSGAELLESLSKSDIVTDSFGAGIQKYIKTYGLDSNITVQQLIDWDHAGADENNKPTVDIENCINHISEYMEANDISFDVTYNGLSGYITDKASNVPNITKPTPKDTEYTSAGITDIVTSFNERNPDRKFKLLTTAEFEELQNTVNISKSYNSINSFIDKNISNPEYFLQTIDNNMQVITECFNKGEITELERDALTERVKHYALEFELKNLRNSISETKSTGDIFIDTCVYIYQEMGKLRHKDMSVDEIMNLAPLNIVALRISGYDRYADRKDLYEFIERYRDKDDTFAAGKTILDGALNMLKG